MAEPWHLINELRAHGVTEYRVEMGGKHPRLIFQWKGREQFYVFPNTPGDNRRGEMNAVSNLRRLMGVERVAPKKSARPKKTRSRASAPKMPDSFTVRPDPWLALAPLREQLQAAEAPIASEPVGPKQAPRPGFWARLRAWWRRVADA